MVRARSYLRSLLNWLIEFGPIAGFFISLYLRGDTARGFLASTALFVELTLLALLVAYVAERRVALFPLLAGTFVIAFGTAAVVLREPRIFIIKDTVYNGMFAVMLWIGVGQEKGFLKPLFISLFDISDYGWYRLSLRWAVMFSVLTLSNEIVWRNFSQHDWVLYKLAATVATTLFGFYQITLTRKERNPSASPWGLRIHGVSGDIAEYLLE